MDEDWIIEIIEEGKRTPLSLSDGTTIHFSSRHIAQRYFREWRERGGYERNELKIKYVKLQ